MAKKIIICSDGTGNKGGETGNTNVFRLYRMLDLSEKDQIAFYDDGIGTESLSKYYRALSGAFGFGFSKNVMVLYRYLTKHYEPGDKIYMFGFSRGAATIRALVGMIQTLGLMRNDHPDILKGDIVDDVLLHIEVMKAMRLYKNPVTKEKEIQKFKDERTHGTVPIEMVGLWDTVFALGFPKDSSWLIIGISKLTDWITKKIFPQRGYKYVVNKNIKSVYHALAIDDDRYTFHPKVFDETLDDTPKIMEQVWFAGSHSNVGGGYPRVELSMITLDWMLERCKKHGLTFHEQFVEDVKAESNPAGRLYNSRMGFFRYYRFAPRHISNLCQKDGKSILRGNIKIHSSVLERMRLVDYYPILPNKFEIVGDETGVYEENEEEVRRLKKRANLLTKLRTINYHVFVETSFLVMFLVWYFFKYGESETINSVTYMMMVDMLPNFAQNFAYYSLYQHPWIGTVLFLTIGTAMVSNSIIRVFSDRTYKRINWSLLKTRKHEDVSLF